MNGKANGMSPIMEPSLLRSPLFTGMSELEFNAITAFLERRRLKKNETIFNEGDAGQEMYILLSGELNAFKSQSDGTQRWMFAIVPGDFFGEMCIIANEPRSATISAKEDSDLMVLQGIDFYRIVFDHPMVGIKMLKAISSVQNIWLDQTSKHLSDIMRWGEKARRRAITDELTGLYNRRFLEDSIKDRFSQGAVGLRTMSLMMMDLDKVHQINDKHGTKAGDMVIVSVADTIRSLLRAGDISARLSGDEFAVLLPDTDGADAKHMGEFIRESVLSKKVQVPKRPGSPDMTEIQVRTSIGIAVAPVHAKSSEGLIICADDALRAAKERGRNRVELAG